MLASQPAFLKGLGWATTSWREEEADMLLLHQPPYAVLAAEAALD